MSYLALGPNIFQCLPMTLSKLTRDTKSNWAPIARFGGDVARQFTGHGEHTFKLEGLVYNSHFGGFDQYEGLRATQLAAQPVPLIGMSAGFAGTVFGLVVILHVSDTQEYLDPETGIGKKLVFEVEVAPFGGEGPFGGLFG
ncbi:MAG: phage tail protein [Rhizobiales bacterium]|nr:phage tail protein [Hyphomicrobiales bacterium]